MKGERLLCAVPGGIYGEILEEVSRTMYDNKHETVGNLPIDIAQADLSQILTGYCKRKASLVVVGDEGSELSVRIRQLDKRLPIVAYTSEPVSWADIVVYCNETDISNLIEVITALEH